MNRLQYGEINIFRERGKKEARKNVMARERRIKRESNNKKV